MAELFYFVSDPSEAANNQLAIESAISMANSDPDIKEIILLTDTITNILPLQSLHVSASVGSLKKGVQQGKFLLRHDAMTTFTESSIKGKRILVAFAPQGGYLDQADDFASVRHLIVVPGSEHSLAPWIRRRNPSVIQKDKTLSHQVSVNEPSALVREALDELSGTNNAASRLYSLVDIARAKTYARTLFKFEPDLDADSIEDYLLQKKGWRTVRAKGFADLLRKLLGGGHFKGGERSGLADHYKRWLERVAAKDKENLG